MGNAFEIFMLLLFVIGAWRERTGTLILTTRQQEQEADDAYLREQYGAG